MNLIDLTHTSHCRVNTGIQRVCRKLHQEFEQDETGITVTFDPYRNAWRELTDGERSNLNLADTDIPDGKRGTFWPINKRIKGYLGRAFNIQSSDLIGKKSTFQGLVVPEIFGPQLPHAYSALSPKIGGPKVAIFYDAVTLSLPEYAPKNAILKFPAYLKSLLWFDGIAAISEASSSELIKYWEKNGYNTHPPVVSIPLGTDIHQAIKENDNDNKRDNVPIILTVATIEGRKNHLSLLQAAETLWEKGHSFHLRLVGKLQKETGQAALDYLQQLQRSGRAIEWLGPLSESNLRKAYRECRFTIYPSLHEGFGIPILESLSFGKPCICTDRGALPESARGGGCLVVKETQAKDLAKAMGKLLGDNDLYEKLVEEARSRRFKSWHTYCRELQEWMNSI